MFFPEYILSIFILEILEFVVANFSRDIVLSFPDWKFLSRLNRFMYQIVELGDRN